MRSNKGIFNEDEKNLIRESGIKFDLDNPTDDELFLIEDKIGVLYSSEVQDYPDRCTDKMFLCMSIIDKINKD